VGKVDRVAGEPRRKPEATLSTHANAVRDNTALWAVDFFGKRMTKKAKNSRFELLF
jgi:hypothetical protein